MVNKIIGCSVFKIHKDSYYSNVFWFDCNLKSTRSTTIEVEVFKFLTGMKKLPSDFSSRCNSCSNNNCILSFCPELVNEFNTLKLNDNILNKKSKREHYRLTTDLKCIIKYNNINLDAIIKNISLSGMMISIIYSNSNLKVGEKVSIHLDRPDTKTYQNTTNCNNNCNKPTLEGIITWIKGSRAGIRFPRQTNLNNFLSGL